MMLVWTNPVEAEIGSADLLIVVPDDFMSALEPYVEHRYAQGMGVLVLPMSTVRAWPSQADDSVRLKRFIAMAANWYGVRYVMLAGHAGPGGVPTCRRSVKQPPSAPITANYNATDYYYADLFKADGKLDSWDASGDGHLDEQTWGQSSWVNPDGVIGYPDVALGRVPAHDARDLARYLAKVMAYESQATPTRRSVALLAVHGYGGSDHILDGAAEAWQGLPRTDIARRAIGFRADEVSPGWTPFPSPVGPATQPHDPFAGVVEDVVATEQWLCHVGHGNSSSWADVITAAGIRGLHNANNFPIVVSAGCETGQFVPSVPWDEYVDQQGRRHRFSEVGSPPTSIKDGVDGSSHPLPLAPPLPTGYDTENLPDGRSLGSAWLFASVAGMDKRPSGAIAYIGESQSLQVTNAAEMQHHLLRSSLAPELARLGDVWLAAQRQYWQTHETSQGWDESFEHPRIYLAILHLFGDPTLRLVRPDPGPPTYLMLGNPGAAILGPIWLEIWGVDSHGRRTHHSSLKPGSLQPVCLDGRRILLRRPDGAEIWQLDEQLMVHRKVIHAGIHGWQPISLSGRRLLWQSDDGRCISIWTLTDDGFSTGQYREHGPFDHYRVVNLSGDRLLWRGTEPGVGVVWRLTEDNAQASYREYTGLGDWVPTRLAGARIAWVNAAGAVSLWTIDDEANQTHYHEHGPFEGYRFVDVDGDRVLFGCRGGFSLWSVDPDGVQLDYYEEHDLGWGFVLDVSVG